MSRYALAAAAALSSMLASSAAMAATTANAATPFTIQVVVANSCTVNTSGSVTMTLSGSTWSGTGRVTANCTDGALYSITLTSRNIANSFNLKSDAGSNTARIPYSVSLTSFTGGGGSASLGDQLSYGTAFASGTASSKTLVGGGANSTIEFTFTTGTPVGTLIADTYKDTVDVILAY